MSGFLADTARWVASIAVLLFLARFWYVVVSNLTPFDGGALSPAQVAAEDAREIRFATLRKVTVGLDVFFFFLIVIEGAVLTPYLFIHFGLR